jgi:hypothetical protein
MRSLLRRDDKGKEICDDKGKEILNDQRKKKSAMTKKNKP